MPPTSIDIFLKNFPIFFVLKFLFYIRRLMGVIKANIFQSFSEVIDHWQMGNTLFHFQSDILLFVYIFW